MINEIDTFDPIPVTIPFTDISFNIVISEVVVTSWIVMAVIILWAFLATRKMKLVPTGLQNSAEFVVETINKFAINNIGPEGIKYAPYIGALGLFLALANTIGALFIAKPPTRELAVAATLAIMTITLVIGTGIKYKGLKGYIKGLFKPMWFMLPFNLLELIIKPLSLCMRLFGNILGAYILMHMIIENIPAIFPSIACLYFDLFDGGLQAFVFVLLTTLYVAEEVGEHH